MQHLEAQLANVPADPGKERRKQVTWYTGATVKRFSWDEGTFKLTLGMKPENVRMDRLASGRAPVLNSHSDHQLQNVIGVVERGWIEKGKGLAELKFSDRADVDPIWQDIQSGIIRNASVGLSIHRMMETTGEDDKIKSFLAVDWEPMEISIVPIGADPDAGFRSGAEVRFSEAEIVSADIQGVVTARKGEEQMPKDKETNAGAVETRTDPPASQAQAELSAEEMKRLQDASVTAERGRVKSILQINKQCRLPHTFAQRAIEEGTAVDVFRDLAVNKMAALAEQQPNQDGHHVPVEILSDEAEMAGVGMAGALLDKASSGCWTWNDKDHDFEHHPDGKQRLFDGARRYVGMSLIDVAKKCLQLKGEPFEGMNKNEIATRALAMPTKPIHGFAFQSTSDFPGILANVLNKNLRAGYMLSDSQWREICDSRTASDFKTVYELTLDGSARLEEIKEHGEYHRGKLVEGKETWKLSTYGKIIGLSRQAIVNDDLGAFTRTPLLMGKEVANIEADIVFGILTANGNMADGDPLFDGANHLNVTGTGAVISINSLSDGRQLLMTQTSPGGLPMNIIPKILLAPAAQYTLAQQFCSLAYQAIEQGKINPFAGNLKPIGEARLDNSSKDAWYLFGDPKDPQATVLIYGYLEGQEGPYTENKQGFEIDGVDFKIRHDFAAAAIDYRGAVKNAGK
jgi:hypothetical protein